jgi:hypothetical protein
MSLVTPSEVEKALADVVAWGGPVVQEGPITYRILKFIVGSFKLDPILVTEGCVPDHCCEIWELSHLQRHGPMTGCVCY